MIPIIAVNIRRTLGDKRLLVLATVFPLLFILVTGLLAGSPKEPVGLVNPSARLLHLVEHTNGVKVRIEANRASLTDDILRGRVVHRRSIKQSLADLDQSTRVEGPAAVQDDKHSCGPGMNDVPHQICGPPPLGPLQQVEQGFLYLRPPHVGAHAAYVGLHFCNQPGVKRPIGIGWLIVGVGLTERSLLQCCRDI